MPNKSTTQLAALLNSTYKTPVSTTTVKRQLRDAGLLGRDAAKINTMQMYLLVKWLTGVLGLAGTGWPTSGCRLWLALNRQREMDVRERENSAKFDIVQSFRCLTLVNFLPW